MSLQMAGSWMARSRVRALALSAAMENIPLAVFITTAGGDVHEANARGRALMEHHRPLILGSLREAIHERRGDGPFEISLLPRIGATPRFLAVQRTPSDLEADRLAIALQRWHLTPREARVLEPLVNGRPNKAIAAQIGCAERTVELHVTHILQRADVESRTALIAKFWTGL